MVMLWKNIWLIQMFETRLLNHTFMRFKHRSSGHNLRHKRQFTHFPAECSCAVGLNDTPQRIHDCFGLLVLVTLWFAGGFAETLKKRARCDINMRVRTCTGYNHDMYVCLHWLHVLKEKQSHLKLILLYDSPWWCLQNKNVSSSKRARAAPQTPISKVCTKVMDSWLVWHTVTLHMPYCGLFFPWQTLFIWLPVKEPK